VTEIEQIINQDQRLFWDKAAINSEDDRYVIAERILEWGTEVRGPDGSFLLRQRLCKACRRGKQEPQS